MKKFICIILAAACVTVFAVRKHEDDGIYRLHIIANSNSDADQAVKLRVRDAILKCEAVLFSERDIRNASEAKKLLMNSASEIYGAAKDTLFRAGFCYGIKISTGTYDFPDRTYGSVTYPAGEYNAMRVVLGDGKGENWWCVMFPPLCIMSDNAAENSDKNTVEFTSIFGKIGKWFADLFNFTD